MACAVIKNLLAPETKVTELLVRLIWVLLLLLRVYYYCVDW